MSGILIPVLCFLACLSLASAACNHDNVYRGLVRDYTFCSGLLAPSKVIYPTPSNVATYPSSRITSACSCIVTDFKPTSTALRSSELSSKVSTSSTRSPTTKPTSTSSRSSTRTTVSTTIKSSSTSKPTSSISRSSIQSSRVSTKSSSSQATSSPSSTTKPSSTSISKSSSTRSTTKPSSSQSSSTRRSSSSSRSTTASRVSSSSQTSPSSAPTLTGITIKPYASKSSCYHLPTPTAELQVAPINTTGATLPYIDSIYLDPTGTTTVYLLVVSTDGKKYIHDVSDPDQYAIVDEEGNAMYADSTGVHFTTNTCSVVIDIEIENFLQQASAFKPFPTKRDLAKRTKETLFNVIAQLTDQCGQKVADLTPSMDVGSSPCTLIPGSGGGQFTYNCQFPGEKSLSMICEADQQRWIDSLTTGVVGSSTGWTAIWAGARLGLSALMTRAYFQGIVLAALITTGAILGAEALAAIGVMLTIFNTGLTIFSVGTGVLSAIQAIITLYNKNNPDQLKEDICKSTRLKELPLPLTLSAGNTKALLITSLSVAPTTFISTSKEIQDPNQTACCPNPGVCRAYTSCGSSCICGTTSDAKGVCYFGNNPCTTYARCSSNAGCASGFCIVSNCCDYGVCVDPYTCSSLNKRWEWDLMARNDSVGVLTPNGWM